MKVDIAFLCDTVEVDCQGSKIRVQTYGVYKNDVMESVQEIMSIEDIIEAIGFDKVCDCLESVYDIEKIKERR